MVIAPIETYVCMFKIDFIYMGLVSKSHQCLNSCRLNKILEAHLNRELVSYCHVYNLSSFIM